MVAENAERAQALTVHHHLDLMVIGTELGDTSGSEMIARVKALRFLPPHHSTPAILVVERHDIESGGAFRSQADLVCLTQMVASMLIPQVLFLLP
jgi:response regulator RpfG family c-di-GMP phosphodiesterase